MTDRPTPAAAGPLDGTPLRLIDSHCHLQADRFDGDVDAVLAAAQAAGVERILVPGWNIASSRRALDLVELHPWLDAAVGVHPHDAARVDEIGWAQIVAWSSHPQVRAIGETGLDYDRVFSPIEDQLANLRRNLDLAVETGKPAILHCRSRAGARDAQDAMLSELARYGGDPPRTIVHSFSGPVDYAEAMLDLGAVISFSGLVFRRGEEPSADVARIVPLDRVLIETDSPFLSAPGAPRGRNEPGWVGITGRWVASLRNEPLDVVGDSLVATYDRVIGPPAQLARP